MPLYLVEGPSRSVVSLPEMKRHLRVDHDDDDDVITAITAAATARIDGENGYLRRALVAQTWDYKLDCFPSCNEAIRLPLPPLIEVVSIKRIDAAGVEQTVNSSVYHAAGVGAARRATVQLRDGQSWPAVATQWPEPVTIRFIAGYVDTGVSPPEGAVPADIIAAIKLTAAHLYEHRESVVIGVSAVELPFAADWLLWPHRVFD